jgi:DNA replication protein DnaC
LLSSIKPSARNRLDEELKRLCGPKLLIIDEFGYLPLGRNGANLIFQLVSRPYERGALLITSNKSLCLWGEVFGDNMLAAAILDRILHHSITLTIKGETFRLREKRKAGLVKANDLQPYFVERSSTEGVGHFRRELWITFR